MISNLVFADQAEHGGYIGIPYKTLDCQGFVERVLRDCGIKKDWRGSNHMWRDALSWKGTVKDAIEKYGDVPVGAWLFTVKDDGGEVERGYHDTEGNAAHVGIRLQNCAIHSTTGGVQFCAFPAARWTHCGLCKYIDYSEKADTRKQIEEKLNEIIAAVNALRNLMEGTK